MSLFKRGRAKGADDELEDHVEATDAADVDAADVEAAEEQDVDETSATSRDDRELFDRSGGPFDREEVDGPDDRIELGALWLPVVEGVELQLQMDESSGQVTGAFVVLGDSAVQVQAFAAPRTEGIWREVCDEIAAGITEQGGTADPGYGRFGRELLARVPAPQPDGKVEFQPLRFTGVDGPRWLLRAVFHGRAAVEPEHARELEDLVAGVVVDRGREPMGPRELLPLHLPVGAEVSGDVPPGAMAPEVDPRESIASDEPARSYDDLAPFRRGPEITERH